MSKTQTKNKEPRQIFVNEIKTLENSSVKLKGAANPFVLFADSWSNV